MRVLVCGGRDYTDRDAVAWELQRQATMHDDIEFICGYDPDDDHFQGADQLAFEWARSMGYPVFPFPAPWKKLGKPAGPIRNRRMLEWGKPEKVVSFPGGKGTADMIRRTKSTGIKLIEVVG